MNQLFARCFDSSPIGMAIVDLAGKWLKVNASLCELLEYSQEEMLNLSFQDITHPDDIAPDVDLLNQCLLGKISDYSIEKRYYTKSGKVIWVLLMAYLTKDAKDQPLHFFAQIQNITDAKVYKEMRNIALSHAKIGTWAWYPNNDQLVWDETMFSIYEVDPADFSGKYRDFIDRVCEEDKKTVSNKVKTSIEHDEEFTTRFRICLKNNKTRYIEARGKACLDSTGKAYALTGINRDITDQVLYEQEILFSQQQLEVANADLERFAYAVSHDLREPLRTISGFAELLEETQGSRIDEDGIGYLSHICLGTRRMKDLLDSIMDYTKIHSTHVGSLENVHIADIIDQVKMNVMIRLKETRGKIIVHGEMPVIQASAPHVFILFMNLIVNGLKFHKKNEDPVLEIFSQDHGPYWEFKIVDNGIGIDPKHSDEIFEIFHRLKDVSVEGTGVGLSICKKIVQQMRGDIWVDSELGKGSTFTFVIPKTEL